MTMRNLGVVVAVVVLVGAGVPTAIGATPATGVTLSVGGTTAPRQVSNATANGTTTGTSPGTALSSAFSAQSSDLDTSLQTRTLEIRLYRADSPEARARVLASMAARLDDRLATLQRRRVRLKRAAANGTLPATAYEARRAALAARADSLRQLAARGDRETRRLPDATVSKAGLDPATFDRLRNRSVRLDRTLDPAVAGPLSVGTPLPVNRTGSELLADVDASTLTEFGVDATQVRADANATLDGDRLPTRNGTVDAATPTVDRPETTPTWNDSAIAGPTPTDEGVDTPTDGFDGGFDTPTQSGLDTSTDAELDESFQTPTADGFTTPTDAVALENETVTDGN